MKILNSVRSIYEELLPGYGKLKELVDSKFQALRETRWHYESRVKQPQSFALKLESGRVPNSKEMEDFLACSLVVENRAALVRAENLVAGAFAVESRRPLFDDVTHKRSDAFPFDDLRLYVRWRDDSSVRPTGFTGYLFEVQIKTFLQHAWTIATHDLIYKNAAKSWGKERIAYQIKAMLEHAEIAIQEAEALSATALLNKTDSETREIGAILELLNATWPPESLPDDKTRLAINIYTLLRALRLTKDDLGSVLQEETSQGRGKNTLNLSPFCVVVQSLLNRKPEEMLELLQSERVRIKLVIPQEVQLPGHFPKDLRNAIVLANDALVPTSDFSN